MKGMSVVRLESIEFVISLLTLTLVYAVVTTFSGWFRAWVTYQLGDDTPAELGFLSFNPLAHVDPFGALLLAWIGFGWGKKSPIDIDALMQKKWGGLRVALASFADVIALFLLAFGMLLLQLHIVGLQGLPHIYEGLLTAQSLTANFYFMWWPHLSTWQGVIGNAALLIARLSIVLGSIYAIWRLIDVAEALIPAFGNFMRRLPFWAYLILTLLVLVFLASTFYIVMINSLVYSSAMVAALLF